jgi:hypothetical protein
MKHLGRRLFVPSRSEIALRSSLDDVLVGDGALLPRRDKGNGRVLLSDVLAVVELA